MIQEEAVGDMSVTIESALWSDSIMKSGNYGTSILQTPLLRLTSQADCNFSLLLSKVWEA